MSEPESEQTNGAPPVVPPVAIDVIDDDLDSLSEELDAERNEPNLAAIAAHRQKDVDNKAAYSELRDAQGLSFDNSIHVVNGDGSPKLSAAGKLRRRPGRKKGGPSVSRIGAAPSANSTGGINLTPEAAASARATGVGFANFFMATVAQIGGPEWEANKDEQANLELNFARYCEAKGIKDLPPGWALLVAVLGFAARRLLMPETKTNLQRAKEAFASWYAKRKVRKDGTRTNLRDDGQRQNDTSEAISGKE